MKTHKKPGAKKTPLSRAAKGASNRPSTADKKSSRDPSRLNLATVPQIVDILIQVDAGKIKYSMTGPSLPNNEVRIKKNGWVRFTSDAGDLAVSFEPKVGNVKIISGPKGETIRVNAASTGKPGSTDEYKFSVAVLTGQNVVGDDPILRIYN